MLTDISLAAASARAALRAAEVVPDHGDDRAALHLRRHYGGPDHERHGVAPGADRGGQGAPRARVSPPSLPPPSRPPPARSQVFKWVITAFGNMAADKLWFLKMDEFLSTRLPPLPDYGMTPGFKRRWWSTSSADLI